MYMPKTTSSLKSASKITLSISKSLQQGWEAFTSHFADILIAAVATFVAALIVGMIGGILVKFPLVSAVYHILGMFFGAFLAIGWIRIGLGALRNESTKLDQFQQPFGKAFKYLVASFLYDFVVFVGFCAFIVPGIYFVLRYQFALSLIVDKDVGILDAFAMSSQMTRKSKLDLFGLGIMSMFVNMIGFLFLLIGLIVTIPVTRLATLSAYQQLMGKINKASLAEERKKDRNVFLIMLAIFIVLCILFGGAIIGAVKVFHSMQAKNAFGMQNTSQLSGVVPTPQPLSASAKPDTSVSAFYGWYLQCVRAGLNCQSQLSTFAADQSLARELVPNQTRDPFVCAPEMPSYAAIVKADIFPSGNQAYVYVKGVFDNGATTRMSVLTTKLNGVWKIQNVACLQ
jgi:uncharacterized membrane protein